VTQPDKRNPFHALKKQSFDLATYELDRGWEHARVRYALGRLGLGSYRKRLEKKARDLQGTDYLTFALLDEEFPTFPIRLTANRMATTEKKEGGEKKIVPAEPLHRNPKAFHPEWFKNFLALPFSKLYEEAFGSLGQVTQLKPIGMVFPRRGFPQGLVIHNGDVHDFLSPQSSCHLYVGGGKKPMTLVVQSFQSMLDCIHKVQKWRAPGQE
jgi:hypothetical protein